MRKALAVAVAILVAISGASQAASSFDDLVANLKSPNARTRLEAAAALGKTRRAEAVTPLAAAIRSSVGSRTTNSSGLVPNRACRSRIKRTSVPDVSGGRGLCSMNNPESTRLASASSAARVSR